MDKEKAPYIPSTEKRFVVSHDDISQKRYTLIRDIAHDLKMFSFYKEATLKGSLVKGKVLTEPTALITDIDMGVFLDAWEVLRLSDNGLSHLRVVNNLSVSEESNDPVQSIESFNNMFDSQNLTLQQILRLRMVRKLVSAYIQRDANEKSQVARIDAPNVDPEVFFISEDGSFSILNTLKQYVESGKCWQVRAALALPFGMNIDDGLKPYRRSFFEQLQSMDPDSAEQKWQIVREALVINERQGNIPETMETDYPRNLSEAIIMYS